MPCKVLIAAQVLSTGFAKGDPVVAFDEPHEFGAKEGLPNFIQLSIPDATKAQVDGFLAQWRTLFIFTIVNENANGYRVRVEVDPALLAASGVNNQVKQALKDYILNHPDYTVEFFSQTSTSLTVNIAKPADLVAFKNDVNDKFAELTQFRQYYFSGTDVDWAIANSGTHSMTRSEVLARIVNRLEE